VPVRGRSSLSRDPQRLYLERIFARAFVLVEAFIRRFAEIALSSALPRFCPVVGFDLVVFRRRADELLEGLAARVFRRRVTEGFAAESSSWPLASRASRPFGRSPCPC